MDTVLYTTQDMVAISFVGAAWVGAAVCTAIKLLDIDL